MAMWTAVCERDGDHIAKRRSVRVTLSQPRPASSGAESSFFPAAACEMRLNSLRRRQRESQKMWWFFFCARQGSGAICLARQRITFASFTLFYKANARCISSEGGRFSQTRQAAIFARVFFCFVFFLLPCAALSELLSQQRL